jgi:hypothetical protein
MKKRMTLVALLTGTVIGLTACTDSEFDSLYEAPTGNSTANLITGRWGGAVQGFDVRWVLTPTQITVANRCGDTIVGATAAAEINASSIRFLESKHSEDNNCFVDIKPGTFTQCSTQPKTNCFELSEKTLTVHGSALDEIAFTKLQD